jgi:hypothetical protein
MLRLNIPEDVILNVIYCVFNPNKQIQLPIQTQLLERNNIIKDLISKFPVTELLGG